MRVNNISIVIFNNVMRRLNIDGLHPDFLEGAVGTFGLKVIFTGLVFITNIMLTRFLGADSFGIYVYAVTWINFLVIIPILGLDQLLIREVSIHLEDRDWGLLRGIIRWTNLIVLVVSFMVAIVAFAVGRLLRNHNPDAFTSVALALILLPIIALTRLRQSTMRGLYEIIPGQLPEMLIQPVSFMVLMLAVHFLWQRFSTAYGAIGVHIISAAMAFGAGVLLLDKYLPEVVKKTQPTYEASKWLKSAWPLLIFSSMRVIDERIDVIMLGLLKGTTEVGIYAIAVKGATLVAFIFVAINTVLAPTFARLYAANEMTKLQRTFTSSARIGLLASLPLVTALIIFGRQFLQLFGEEFTIGYTALIIVSVSRLFNAGMGSVGFLLIMTGREREVAWGVGLGALLNFFLNVLLIPKFSIVGAAIATAGGTFFWSIVLSYVVYRRLGIYPTVVGKSGWLKLMGGKE